MKTTTVTCVECLKQFEMDALKYEELRMIDGVLYPPSHPAVSQMAFCSTECIELLLLRT